MKNEVQLIITKLFSSFIILSLQQKNTFYEFSAIDLTSHTRILKVTLIVHSSFISYFLLYFYITCSLFYHDSKLCSLILQICIDSFFFSYVFWHIHVLSRLSGNDLNFFEGINLPNCSLHPY